MKIEKSDCKNFSEILNGRNKLLGLLYGKINTREKSRT